MPPREYTAVCLSEPPLAVPLLLVVVRFKTQQRQQATKTVFFFLCVRGVLFCFLPYLFLVLSTQYTVKSIVITCPISTKCATFFW